MGDGDGSGDGVGGKLGFPFFAGGKGDDGGCFVELVEYARMGLA